MKAIFKREVRSYFSSPVGYVCVSVLMALYGFWYYQAMLTSSSSYISSVFGTMFSFSMMIIPIITMRSMCDDQKNKTDQALLTAPVGVTAIVLGKFFACCFVYFVATTLGGILPAIVMSTFSTPSWGEIIGNYIGALLYGAAMISIGVFISSLTVSQIIAAIGTFVVSVFLMYIDTLGGASMDEGSNQAVAQARQILAEGEEEFLSWHAFRALVPLVQRAGALAGEDVAWRTRRLVDDLPLTGEERRELLEEIASAAGKVASRMLYGLREELDSALWAPCVHGILHTL